jgi:hypothetical protein
MEPKFQTSFIPKRPMDGSSASSPLPPIRSTGIIAKFANFIFVITLLVYGGLFGYKYLLNNQIKQADADLVASRAAFEPDTIKSLIDASTRIMSVKKLITNHVVVSELFNELQGMTVRKVRFSNFSYSMKGNDLVVNMDGEALGYNALASQGLVFSESPFIAEPVFSDFSLGETGTVMFKFQAVVNPNLVTYHLDNPANANTNAGSTTESGSVNTTSPASTQVGNSTSTQPKKP